MIVSIKLSSSESVQYDITIDALRNLSFNRKVAIVTNTTVSTLHLDRLLSKIDAPQLEVVTVPDGEEYKTLSTVESILETLFEAKFDRKSLLIAFGGGVIGDMAGFAASLYQRGVDFIQIPTTLLSQVDASVGGKTGVNNQYGKNLVGAFYQPKAVHIDPYFLSTLPAREFAAGIAEVIKMAVMFDRGFFEYLEMNDLRHDAVVKEMIARSVTIKANVVNQDEKEAGIRAVLNYGHTFGHVIENETSYSKYLHGEAVSIGMVMANELAVELGLLSREEANRVLNLLQNSGLPTKYPMRNVDSFYEHFFLDKKSSSGKIKFILPQGKIGTHTIREGIDEKLVKKVLSLFGDNI
ncbi:MAG: 3-dehydroquinate synthase [Sulfurovum sp.]|nr:3-dehydroquinate synthase [Sulfurovum sp.]